MDIFDNYFVPDELEGFHIHQLGKKSCSINKGDVFLTMKPKIEELGFKAFALKDYPDATFNGFTKRLRKRNV